MAIVFHPRSAMLNSSINELIGGYEHYLAMKMQIIYIVNSPELALSSSQVA